MSIQIQIPTSLAKHSDGQQNLESEGRSVRQVLESLKDKYPKVTERLLNDEGELRPFVCVMIGENDIRLSDGLDTSVSEGDRLSVAILVAGG